MSDGEELIRDVWRRWNAGQREPDVESFDPEMEIRSALTGKSYHGADGVREWIAEIDGQFESWRLVVEDVRGVTPEDYVVRGEIRARGRNSGVSLDQPASWRVALRDGRILRIENFIGLDAWAEAGRDEG